MGNLRQKYTDEEWDKMLKKMKTKKEKLGEQIDALRKAVDVLYSDGLYKEYKIMEEILKEKQAEYPND